MRSAALRCVLQSYAKNKRFSAAAVRAINWAKLRRPAWCAGGAQTGNDLF
jgi:hypothetical protein